MFGNEHKRCICISQSLIYEHSRVFTKLPDGLVVNSNIAGRIFDARCIARLFNGFNEFANAPAVRVVIPNCLLTIQRDDFAVIILTTKVYQRLLLMNKAGDYIDYSLCNYGIHELIVK